MAGFSSFPGGSSSSSRPARATGDPSCRPHGGTFGSPAFAAASSIRTTASTNASPILTAIATVDIDARGQGIAGRECCLRGRRLTGPSSSGDVGGTTWRLGSSTAPDRTGVPVVSTPRLPDGRNDVPASVPVGCAVVPQPCAPDFLRVRHGLRSSRVRERIPSGSDGGLWGWLLVWQRRWRRHGRVLRRRRHRRSTRIR